MHMISHHPNVVGAFFFFSLSSLAPAVSPGYHSGFMLFHSALLYGGSSNTEVSMGGKRGTTERRETIHLRRRHVLLRVMDALGCESAFPCMRGPNLFITMQRVRRLTADKTL